MAAGTAPLDLLGMLRTTSERADEVVAQNGDGGDAIARIEASLVKLRDWVAVLEAHQDKLAKVTVDPELAGKMRQAVAKFDEAHRDWSRAVRRLGEFSRAQARNQPQVMVRPRERRDESDADPRGPPDEDSSDLDRRRRSPEATVVTLVEVLRDALARVVFAGEAVEDGEYGVAAAVLRDLEADLAAVVEQERAA